MTTRDEVEELFEQVSSVRSEKRVPPAERLMEAADALGDEDLVFRAQLTLVRALNASDARHRMVAPLASALRTYDSAPAWLTERDRYLVLWQHKWMVSALVQYPQVALEQLEEVLVEMRRRYRDAGEGLGPVLGCEYELRAHVHGPAGAQREFDVWRQAPRTALSDCEACEPTVRIGHLAALGRDEEALAELEPLLHRRLRCPDQPQAAVAAALVPLARSADPATVARLHRTSYRASAVGSGTTADVARHIHLLARSGNLTRGVELLERHLPAVDRPATPEAGMYLAAAGVRLLRAVAAADDADLVLRSPQGPVSAAELADRLESRALTLGRAFDERNGTQVVGATVRAWLEAPALSPLPLGPVGAPGVARRARPVVDLPRVPRDARFAEGVERDLDPVGLAELAGEARIRAGAPTWRRLAARWRDLRDDALARADADPCDEQLLLATARLDTFAAWASDERDPELCASAAARYRRLGREAEALLVEIGGETSEPVPAGTVAAVDATGCREDRARVRLSAAARVDGDEARTLRAEVVAMLDGVDDRSPVESTLLASALHDGSGEDRVGALERVVALLGDDLAPSILVSALVDLSWAAREDGPAAHALLDRAVAAGEAAGFPDLVLHAQHHRVGLLLAEADHERAEALALAVGDASLAGGDVDMTVAARTLAAQIMRAHGREVEALELIEATLELEHASEVSGARARRRVQHRAALVDLASHVCADLGEDDRAVHLAREGLAIATGPDADPAGVAVAGAWLAELVARSDAVEATTLYADALEAADRCDQVVVGLAVRRARVAARFDADGLDAALTDLADAERAGEHVRRRAETDPAVAAAVEGWDFEGEAVALAETRMRVLAMAGEHARALEAAVGLSARWEQQARPDAALTVRSLEGALLLETGDERGVEVLEDVFVRAWAHGLEQIAAPALRTAVAWLDRQGRPEEARALWERHGGAAQDA